MFPQVAPKFFKTRAQGPKNLSKRADAEPAAEPAPAPQPTPGARPAGAAMIYDVKFNGHEHRVTVTPAE
jgi:methylmalonyl-CoA carboxyltransferase 5S subunit